MHVHPGRGRLDRTNRTAMRDDEDVTVRMSLDDLCEVDVGSWTGLTRAEVETQSPDAFRRTAASTRADMSA